jgi:hypothetical protein
MRLHRSVARALQHAARASDTFVWRGNAMSVAEDETGVAAGG